MYIYKHFKKICQFLEMFLLKINQIILLISISAYSQYLVNDQFLFISVNLHLLIQNTTHHKNNKPFIRNQTMYQMPYMYDMYLPFTSQFPLFTGQHPVFCYTRLKDMDQISWLLCPLAFWWVPSTRFQAESQGSEENRECSEGIYSLFSSL